MADDARWAEISGDGVYRYLLGRQWNFDKTVGDFVCWIMLNPSTADAEVDDPTIRRCIGFSKSWGYDGLLVVNCFALRATNPQELAHHADPAGPANDVWIDSVISAPMTKLVVAGWGASKAPWNRSTPINAAAMKARRDLHALGVTKDGYPRHPLYVKGDTQPALWKDFTTEVLV